MRYGIISDIHGNLEALESVLAAINDVDVIVCLGDVVGYGANPNECCELVREHCKVALLGNHDAAVLGMMDLTWFNEMARTAVLWTREQLNRDNWAFLESLPTVKCIDDAFTAVHGSLRNPIEEYILDHFTAHASLTMLNTRIGFFGHTHIAEAYEWFPRMQKIYHINLSHGGEVQLRDDARYLVNCGGVGQPRDDNPQASFGVYDTEGQVVEVIRVDYDVETAAQKIVDAGLPALLAQRLFWGR